MPPSLGLTAPLPVKHLTSSASEFLCLLFKQKVRKVMRGRAYAANTPEGNETKTETETGEPSNFRWPKPHLLPAAYVLVSSLGWNG